MLSGLILSQYADRKAVLQSDTAGSKTDYRIRKEYYQAGDETTIIVENGKVVQEIGLIDNPKWKCGIQMKEKLHAELLCLVTKKTIFEELYYHMNEFIVKNRFVNLGFMGNLGHSIVRTKGNMVKLGDMKYFIFELHIAFPDSKYGYKKEHIYYFDENGVILAYEVMEKELHKISIDINYDGRKFIPKMNSENGEIGEQTNFTYHQNGNLLWAEYSGGDYSKGESLLVEV